MLCAILSEFLFILKAIDWDNNAINTKYCILQMMHKDMDIKEGDATLSAVTMQEIRYIQTVVKILKSKCSMKIMIMV